MYKIIEELEKKLQEAQIPVIDKHDDGFAYFIAVKHNGKTFVVFTTKGIHHFRKNGDCLVALEVEDFIPFSSVTPERGNFTDPYMSAMREHYEVVINEKNYGLTVEQLPFFQ